MLLKTFQITKRLCLQIPAQNTLEHMVSQDSGAARYHPEVVRRRRLIIHLWRHLRYTTSTWCLRPTPAFSLDARTHPHYPHPLPARHPPTSPSIIGSTASHGRSLLPAVPLHPSRPVPCPPTPPRPSPSLFRASLPASLVVFPLLSPHRRSSRSPTSSPSSSIPLPLSLSPSSSPSLLIPVPSLVSLPSLFLVPSLLVPFCVVPFRVPPPSPRSRPPRPSPSSFPPSLLVSPSLVPPLPVPHSNRTLARPKFHLLQIKVSRMGEATLHNFLSTRLSLREFFKGGTFTVLNAEENLERRTPPCPLVSWARNAYADAVPPPAPYQYPCLEFEAPPTSITTYAVIGVLVFIMAAFIIYLTSPVRLTHVLVTAIKDVEEILERSPLIAEG
ncbi:hypothetical protein C8R44DRAFT_983201 [Mycena epipterygia]|nr:hypothetical protein C8R44DRAFT_983201 [Mycena epipterygia]